MQVVGGYKMQPTHLKIFTHSVHKLSTLSVKMLKDKLFEKEYLKMIMLRIFKKDFSACFLGAMCAIKYVVTGRRQKRILPVEENESG